MRPSCSLPWPMPTILLALLASVAPLCDGSTAAAAVESLLEAHKDDIDNNLFLYETPQRKLVPSSVYRFDGFIAGLRVMHQVGVANKFFYMGDDSNESGHVYGLVNIAAFLAQSLKETIKYDACDENSWDLINGRYPLSNACGQLGQSYQDYHCSPQEAHMECRVDPNMKITAVTHAKWYGAPGPLKCGPKSIYPSTGFWDYSKECNKPWASPPETCSDYEGQQAGGENNDRPFGNANGREDVEGCCYWGRGVIQTTGICNFGKLNYFLGKRAADEGRYSRYPTIDFCADPEAICASEEFKELKWIAGLFYWVESLQSYNRGGWNYMSKLHEFVDGGLTDMSFIHSVSGIVNRGCHNPPCGTGPLDGGEERKANFQKVIDEFGLGGGNNPPPFNGWSAANTNPTPTTPAPTPMPLVPSASPPTPTNPMRTTPAPTPTAPTPTAPAPTPTPTPPTPTATVSTSASRCGLDWMDAANNCGATCLSNADCLDGMACWASISCTRRRGLRGKDR